MQRHECYDVTYSIYGGHFHNIQKVEESNRRKNILKQELSEGGIKYVIL